ARRGRDADRACAPFRHQASGRGIAGGGELVRKRGLARLKRRVPTPCTAGRADRERRSPLVIGWAPRAPAATLSVPPRSPGTAIGSRLLRCAALSSAARPGAV